MIRGFWSPTFPLPLLDVAVWLPGLTETWALVTFVIDMGSTHSCIHPRDATVALGLDPRELDPATWTDIQTTEGIGGLSAYRSVSAQLAFSPTNRMNRRNASRMVRQLGGLSAESASLPSLLGWDVLRHFRLTIDSDEVSLEPR